MDIPNNRKLAFYTGLLAECDAEIIALADRIDKETDELSHARAYQATAQSSGLTGEDDLKALSKEIRKKTHRISTMLARRNELVDLKIEASRELDGLRFLAVVTS